MNKMTSFLLGASLGAAAAYLWDPDGGDRRRALLRDKGIAGRRKAALAVNKAARRAANQIQGVAARIGRIGAVSAEAWVEDGTLEAQVRAHLGHLVSHPSSVETEVREGCVNLSGPILAGEVEPLMDGLRSIPGVQRVVNQLEIHQEAGNVPGLQGGGSPSQAPS